MTTALDFVCSTCGARVGAPCMVVEKVRDKPHAARAAQARTALAKLEHTGKSADLIPRRVAWNRYQKCWECGAEAHMACRDDDDEVREQPCTGRVVSLFPRKG